MNARISMREYRAAKKQENAFAPRWQDYEIQKQQWIRTHPEATSAEYQAAMVMLARRCGV